MSARDASGSAPQHSHPHNNTVSRNEKFCVDQVTVPHPPCPPGERQGVGNDKRGGGGTLHPVSCRTLSFWRFQPWMSIILTRTQLVLLSNSSGQKAVLCLPGGVEKDSDSASDTKIVWAKSVRGVWRLANVFANEKVDLTHNNPEPDCLPQGLEPLPNLLPSLRPKLPHLVPKSKPRVQPNRRQGGSQACGRKAHLSGRC